MVKKESPKYPAVTPGRPPEWPRKLAPLTRAPQQWFVIASYPKSRAAAARELASSLRTGKRVIPPGRWEFHVEPQGQRMKVFARYLGK